MQWFGYRVQLNFFRALALLMCGMVAAQGLAAELTIEQMKARFKDANDRDRPKLGLQIAERQMEESDKLYAANDFDKAQATLTDVVTYSELARDSAIQSHKYQKQSEIAVRGMIRKLSDLMHSLPREGQAPLQNAITRLQRVRDDLLIAMFPKSVSGNGSIK